MTNAKCEKVLPSVYFQFNDESKHQHFPICVQKSWFKFLQTFGPFFNSDRFWSYLCAIAENTTSEKDALSVYPQFIFSVLFEP